MPVVIYGVNLAYAESLIRELEAHPDRVPAYYSDLEAAIAWLMDTTFEATDPKHKARVAGVEMRARLVLERHKKSSVD